MTNEEDNFPEWGTHDNMYAGLDDSPKKKESGLNYWYVLRPTTILIVIVLIIKLI